MKMYINGVLQQSTDLSTDPIGSQSGNNSDKVSIGKWGNLNIRYFNGEIDEVRLWEVERSQIEIHEKMCSKLAGNEPGLRAYYQFDNQSGNSLFDNGQNDFNGTLLTMTDSNRIFSGAPLGEVSIYLYDNVNLGGQSLLLNTRLGDNFLVNNINSNAKGVHIYKVNALPNSLLNLSNPLTENYYGVFLADISGTFNVNYDFSGYDCSLCNGILSRNDNATLSWTSINGIYRNCSIGLINQSSIGYDYRAEFIIDNSHDIKLDLGSDITLCQGTTLTLDATTSNATYLWQDNSTHPTFNATQPGTYLVEIMVNGCFTNDTINVLIEECETILVMPNVFTPNQDGINDWFIPIESERISSMHTTIYNRWGKEVFSSNHPMIVWKGITENGIKVSDGVYFWVIYYTDIEGNKSSAKGHVTLLRSNK